ncbi:MAG: DNA polymerase II large subunit, partial [archaeon]|nr:DNA polymerase II large subunit [archaeon]
DLNGGNPYLSMYFSGPIRAAGGTVQAFCVLIADYVREKMKITRYKATEKEISRIVEEVKLYDRVVNLQYPSTKEELEYAIRNLKVELNGDPTEKREVSANRNLRRIETNFIRSGPCLVLNDGVLLKSKKIMKVIDKMEIPGWEWLKEVKKYSHTDDDNKKGEAENQKEGEYGGGLYDGSANKISEELPNTNQEVKTPVEIRRSKLNERIPPIFKYIADVIGGRPVFAYPSKEGGHRIRYGRSRNTGLAACGMNPNGMYILNNFIAVGTQIKIERPGKAGSVMPVSSIEGPVCLHKNGDVIQYNEPNSYKQINEENPIKKILWIGDISFGFGEFAENNHTLLPSGYVEEWWVLELEKSSEFSEKKQKNIQFWIDNP